MLENQMDFNIKRPFELFAPLDLTQRKKKILIVDDDQDFRLSLSEFLLDKGFKVRTAKGADVALRQLLSDHETPDLILLDVMMPDKSGPDFQRELMTFEMFSAIPVIFMTGFEVQGLGEYLLKPIQWDHLLLKLCADN